MKFFKPIVQLARQHNIDADDTYFLHVVTFCPRSCYRADGYDVNAAQLTTGLYEVTVNLLQDASLPDLEYITPVAHTMDLGTIAFPGGEGWIQVTVRGAVLETERGATRDTTPKTTSKTGGSGTVSTSDADDKSRPISENSLI